MSYSDIEDRAIKIVQDNFDEISRLKREKELMKAALGKIALAREAVGDHILLARDVMKKIISGNIYGDEGGERKEERKVESHDSLEFKIGDYVKITDKASSWYLNFGEVVVTYAYSHACTVRLESGLCDDFKFVHLKPALRTLRSK